VEVYTSEFDVFTIHFDDEGEHYLQLQALFERDEDESARVYVEVDDQGLADADCFSLAELRRDSFRLVLSRTAALGYIGELVVSFELSPEVFEQLRSAMARVFDGVEEYRFSGELSK
jgi:hypothetical protein